MTDLLQKALEDCCSFHSLQKDKAGKPYFYHPIYVALQQKTESAKITALLHDAVEDGCCTPEYIGHVYGKAVQKYVDLLTRRENEKYFDYIHRIKDSNEPVAISVKLADLNHNTQFDRFDIPSPEIVSLRQRYYKAIRILKGEQYES